MLICWFNNTSFKPYIHQQNVATGIYPRLAECKAEPSQLLLLLLLKMYLFK